MRFPRFLPAAALLALLPMCGSTASDAPLVAEDAGGTHDASTDATNSRPGADGDALAPDGGTPTRDGSTTSGSADASPAGDSGVNKLDVSFAFTGCNRLQKADWDTQATPNSANLPQLH